MVSLLGHGVRLIPALEVCGHAGVAGATQAVRTARSSRERVIRARTARVVAQVAIGAGAVVCAELDDSDIPGIAEG